MTTKSVEKKIIGWLAARHGVGSPLDLRNDYRKWRGNRDRLGADLGLIQRKYGEIPRGGLVFALKVFAEEGHGVEAKRVFGKIEKPGVGEYSMLLRAEVMGGLTVGGGDLEGVREIFREMEEKKISPDAGCFQLLVRSLGRNKALGDRGDDTVLETMSHHKILPTVQILNELVSYQRDINAAVGLLSKFEREHGVGANASTMCAVLKVCRESKDARAARKLYKKFTKTHQKTPIQVTNSYLQVLSHCGHHNKVVEAFTQLPNPTAQTYSILLQSAAASADPHPAQAAHQAILTSTHLRSKAAIGSLMSVYAATRNAEGARKLMDWCVKTKLHPSEVTLRSYRRAVGKEEEEEK